MPGGQAAAEVSLETLKAAIAPSVPAGYQLKRSDKYMLRLEYGGDAAVMENLIYAVHARKRDFTEMDRALGAAPFDWQGHPAIYIDGAETGMSVVAVKLGANKGILYITDRTLGGKPFDLERFKAILAKVDLKALR